MKFVCTIAFASAIFASCGTESNHKSWLSTAESKNEQRYVRLPKAMLSEAFVRRTGFIQDHGSHAIFAVGWLNTHTLEGLSHEERLAITELDEENVIHGLLNPFTLVENKLNFANEGDAEDYHNYNALTLELQNLQSTYSELASLESIGKSGLGRELWLMRVTAPKTGATMRPKLLYVANMHGDEVVGRELSIYLLRHLLADFKTDSKVKALLEGAEIFIVPSMNPDGYENKKRFSNKGTDLNRNFPDFVDDPNDTPTGRDVETQAVMSLHAKHHFVAALNFHGGSVCFNLPWDTIPNSPDSKKFGDDQVLAPMARAYADSNPTMYANQEFDHGVTYGYEWYRVSGGLQDWSNFYRNSMHATVELSFVKWPQKTQLPIAWDENKDSMQAYLERAIIGVHVAATDESDQPITGMSVAVSSSKRSVSFKDAFGTRTTLEGPQTVTVSAPGYKSTSVTLNARSFNGQYDKVILKK